MKIQLINYTFLAMLFIAGTCKHNTGKPTEGTAAESPVEKNKQVELEPLQDEIVKLKGKDPFGNVIELKGIQLIADTALFKVQETEMIVKDNLMLVKARNEGNTFMIFKLPGMQLMHSFGRVGRGPDEFNYPHLIRTTEQGMLAACLEMTNSKIYHASLAGEMVPLGFTFQQDKPFSSLQGGLIDRGTLCYVNNSPSGKSIFKAELRNDSTIVTELQSLALDPKRKGWANYIGDFAENRSKDRMVYAYKYFKIVKFFDTKHNTVRMLNFEREELDESTVYRTDGLDANVTHYWGICPQDEYVYLLYSGRTPVEVGRGSQKDIHYIHVEKYDWNGNPIAKYKLDRWGYFTVDEKSKKLYIASVLDDDPFFVFELP